jgi:hypothetical protein
LVGGEVTNSSNQEHKSEESRNDCADSKENCDACEGSHMGEFAYFRLLSFRVITSLGGRQYFGEEMYQMKEVKKRGAFIGVESSSV